MSLTLNQLHEFIKKHRASAAFFLSFVYRCAILKPSQLHIVSCLSFFRVKNSDSLEIYMLPSLIAFLLLPSFKVESAQYAILPLVQEGYIRTGLLIII